MLKVALLVAALATASTAQAVNLAPPAGTALAEAAPCRSASAPDLDCATRALDADATPSPTELPGFAMRAAAPTDFKNGAVAPAPMLATLPDTGDRRRLLPALFALGALVVLLRKRPL